VKAPTYSPIGPLSPRFLANSVETNRDRVPVQWTTDMPASPGRAEDGTFPEATVSGQVYDHGSR
jgi:hypothetical protein